MNKRKRFYSNTLLLYLMTLAKYVFPLITLPYLTRILEPDIYGVVVYMTATVGFFQILVDFGFNLSATKDIAVRKEDKQSVQLILGSVIQAKLILAILAILIFTIMVLFVPIMRENILLSYLFMGTVILSVWLPDFLFRGIERMEIITIRFIVSKSISTILIFFIVHSKDDVLWVPILNMLGSLAAIALAWYHIKKTLQYQIKLSKLYVVIEKIKESSIYFISTFATTAFGAVNTFMLGVMSLPTTQIAYWGISYTLITSAQSLYGPITNSLYPHMVNKKDFNLVKKILLIFIPPIIITTFLVGIFSEYILAIFSGTEYVEAKVIFIALLPILVFSFPAQILGFPVLGVMGKVKETTGTTVLSAVFHIAGLLALASFGKFNILNVAILRSITEAVLMSSRIILLVYIRNTGKRVNYNGGINL